MKPTLTIILTLLSMTAFAQGESLDEIAQDLERNKAMSLSYIEAMPEDNFSYKPTEGVRTYAEQFLHLAQGLVGLSSNGTGAERIFGQQNLEKNEDYKTKSEVKRLVTESYDYAISSVKNMDASTLNEVIVRGQFEVTRLGWINKALEHSTHHKGQAAVYLRMNGITPPQFQLF